MNSCWNAITSAIDSLKPAPRELYVCFVIKICDSFAYFALAQIAMIYFHDEFGLTDIQAGAVYGAWGAAITIWGLITSFINDNLGVRTALLVGYVITFTSLLVISLTTSLTLLLVFIFIFLPLGNSMGIPMITIGIKRFTNSSNRALAFGLFYSSMNIGAVFAGPVVDFFNVAYEQGVTIGQYTISGNRMVIFSSAIAISMAFVATLLFLRDIKVSDQTETGHNPEITLSFEKAVEEYSPKQRGFLETFRQLMKSPTFWRFAMLSLLLVNLNSIFRYLDALFPTYLVRTFGPDVPKGMIFSINPAMIIVLTPMMAAFTRTYAHYAMIKYGGYVSALSPLFLVGSNSIWASVMFVFTLSLGEAIWSPRVYDYTMSVAPEGREASFTALATAPLFAAKFPVGLFSGFLLETYLPEYGHRDPQMMWLVITCVVMTSPICVTLFERCVREPEESMGRKLSDPAVYDGSINPMVADVNNVSPRRKTSIIAKDKSSVVEYDA